jgi:thioesterase domain-containing protein
MGLDLPEEYAIEALPPHRLLVLHAWNRDTGPGMAVRDIIERLVAAGVDAQFVEVETTGYPTARAWATASAAGLAASCDGRRLAVIGYSAGGFFAREVAVALAAGPDAPVFVGALDTFIGRPVKRLRDDTYIAYRLPMRFMLDDQATRLRSRGGNEGWSRVTASVIALTTRNLIKRVKRRVAEGIWRPSVKAPDSARLMVTAPTPSRKPFEFHVYAAPATIERHQNDPSIGWSGRHDGPLTIRTLSHGDHFTCLEGATGDELVSLIRGDLTTALAQVSGS